MKPFVIPFFLDQAGCRHPCLYCSQRRSGGRRDEPLSPRSVTRGIEAGLASPRRKPGARVEAAFFGGTFTALSRSRQSDLLGACGPFLRGGRIQGLRLSTRPDALSVDEVAFLKSLGVTTVEIGAQSMDDRVLSAAGRGHTADQTREAAARVKGAGLGLGLQLMPGLPGEDEASRRLTLEAVLGLGPDEVRLYPLLVLEGTPLAGLWRSGLYRPLSLDRAVAVCAGWAAALTAAGAALSRIGLQDSRPTWRPRCWPARTTRPSATWSGAKSFFRPCKGPWRPGRPGTRGRSWRSAPGTCPGPWGDRRDNLNRLRARFDRPDLAIRPDPRLAPGRFRWRGETFSVLPGDRRGKRPETGRATQTR